MQTERLTLALPSFVADTLLPRLATSGAVRSFRALCVPSPVMADYARRGIVAATITIPYELALPPGWSTAHVGAMRYALFASPAAARALGNRPSVEDLRRHPFVGPVDASRAGTGVLVPGDDGCPLPIVERTIVHEVENMTLACRVAADADHLVYGPVLAATSFVSSGRLVQLDVPGWSKADAVHLACDDAAMDREQREALADALCEVLGAPRYSGVVELEPVTRAAKAHG